MFATAGSADKCQACRELGAELIAISPQTREKNAEVKKKQRLAFPVLSDPENSYARQLSLVFKFPDEPQAVYQGFGIDLPGFNGDQSWELPIPARIVVDKEGRIQSLEADPDYTHRPEPEATFDVVQSLV